MAIITDKVIAIRDDVIVKEMNFAEQKTASGIIVQSDNGKSEGVKPRWAQVWEIGPEQTMVKIGQWVLIEHGRWTRGLEVLEHSTGEEITIRRVETKSMMAVADHCPVDINLGEGLPPSAPDFDFTQPMY